MDAVIQYIGVHFAQELTVITQAPIIFLITVSILGLGLWFALRAYYHHQLTTNESRIQLLHDRLESGGGTVQPGKSFSLRYQVVRQCAELAAGCRKAASDTASWIILHNRIVERRIGEAREEGEYEVGWQKEFAEAECKRLRALADEFEKLAEQMIDDK